MSASPFPVLRRGITPAKQASHEQVRGTAHGATIVPFAAFPDMALLAAIVVDPPGSLQGPRRVSPGEACRGTEVSAILPRMSQSNCLPRSPELMSRQDTALLVVDVQTKLLRVMTRTDRLLWNIRRLIDAARVLGVPVEATEQYPQGLGPTTETLLPLLDSVQDKQMFSCRECGGIFQQWRDRGIFKILVVGIEAHVCVQQTVLDLLAHGFQVFVACDAVESRFPPDRDIALRRMETQGAILTTTEAALFEWCETAAAPEFKAISALVREPAPE